MCPAEMRGSPLWPLRDQSGRHVLNPYIDLDVRIGIFSTNNRSCMVMVEWSGKLDSTQGACDDRPRRTTARQLPTADPPGKGQLCRGVPGPASAVPSASGHQGAAYASN